MMMMMVVVVPCKHCIRQGPGPPTGRGDLEVETPLGPVKI